MAKPATAGNLRFRVRFDKQIEESSPYGGTTSSWQEQFTRWAAIQPMKGSEPVIAQRLTGVQPVLIIVRKDSQTKTIDTSWRAVEMLNGVIVKTYALKTCEDMERGNSYLTMLAEAGAADGGAD